MGLVNLKESFYKEATDGGLWSGAIEQDHPSIIYGRIDAKAPKYVDLAEIKNTTDSPVKALHRIQTMKEAKVPHAKPNRPSLPRWALSAVSIACLASLGLLVASVFSLLLEVSIGGIKLILPSITAIVLFTLLTLITFRLNSSIKEVTSGVLK